MDMIVYFQTVQGMNRRLLSLARVKMEERPTVAPQFSITPLMEN
jgi:hypothetical protein